MWSRADDATRHQAFNYELGVVGIQTLASFAPPFVFPPPVYRISDTPFKQSDHFDCEEY